VLNKTLIGWCEYISLPDWKFAKIKAKVDTGAKTSSLDVSHIEYLSNKKVRFHVRTSQRSTRKHKVIIAPISRISHVQASPSHREKRIFVKTHIKIGAVEKKIEINLVDRSNMNYRMLLGRTALKENFLVDVGHEKVTTQ